MQTRRRTKLALAGILIVTLLAFLWLLAGRDDKALTSAELDIVSFRLKWVVYAAFAGELVGVERGLFRENGIDLRIQPGGVGLDPIKLVASGSDHFGLAGPEQILIAREQGIPVIAVGEQYKRSGVGFFSLAGVGITTPEDFVGKRVGVLPGTDKDTLYRALLETRGIDRARIDEVPVQVSMAPLFAREIDVYPGFVVNQPAQARQAGFELTVIDPYEYDVRPGGNVYFTSERLVKERPDLVVRFLRAAFRSWETSLQMDDAGVVDLVMRHGEKLDRVVETEIWRATVDLLIERDPAKFGLMSEEKWRETAELFRNSGLVRNESRFHEAFTNQFAREAKMVQEGGTP